MAKMFLKPLQFEKTVWPNYFCQFEAAAKQTDLMLKEKATALTLARKKKIKINLGNIEKLNLRNISAFLAILPLPAKKLLPGTSEEFEIDMAHLVSLAYSDSSETNLKSFAPKTIFYGLWRSKTKQSLKLARPNKLEDALAAVLELEATVKCEQSRATLSTGRIYAHFLDNSNEDCKKLMNKNKQPQYWTCDQLEYV